MLLRRMGREEEKVIPVQVTAGAYHSCALFSNGSVKCWGRNGNGQLGNKTFKGTTHPEAVLGITSVRAISAGGFHTCALLDGGRVACWGTNDSGQIGDGPFGGVSLPKEMAHIEDAVAVSAGSRHTCALLSATLENESSTRGTVHCWGGNQEGQLGIGTSPESSSVPVPVPKITKAKTISAGGSHSCVLLSGGSIACWGGNEKGQLGRGLESGPAGPWVVAGIEDAIAVSAGGSHSCAVLSNGSVRCWGENNNGQLGTAQPGNSPEPLRVPGIENAVAVTAGAFHSCAQLKDGTLKCWGSNDNGQLGVNATENASSENASTLGSGSSTRSPLAVPAMSAAAAVSAGAFHTCALDEAKRIECWGTNDSGQIGIGDPKGHAPARGYVALH